jgi:hypothetical protein
MRPARDPFLSPKRTLHLGAAWALLWACAACGLRLNLYDSSVTRPSNLALYFSVTDSKGDPVPNLTSDRFRIFEDDQLVSQFESKQTILNPEVAAVQYTLLLVDLSGSVTESGSLQALQPAVQGFADRVGQLQQVGIYGFDGSPNIFPIVGFSSGGGGVRSAAERLGTVHGKDPSTNLNGAVIEGLKLLDKTMAHGPAPLKFGTLVVFTDGTDRASRVTRDELGEALDHATVNVFVIGVGNEINEGELRRIGRTFAFTSKDSAQIGPAFDMIGQRVEAYTKSFYLLSYCSPARAREHDLRVEAQDQKGHSGALVFHFNADGFGPACDPNRPPRFDIHRPRTIQTDE